MEGELEGEKDVIVFNSKEKNYHANGIIDSNQSFSLLEKKLIYCVINQLDISPSNVQRDLFNDICFKIPVSNLGENYGYSNIKSAIKKITNRSIVGGDDNKQHAFSINPFPFAELKNGVIELTMFSKAVPYFIDLKTRGYTSYELDIALSLTSVYSQRVYELLSSNKYRSKGEWVIEIDRFKYLLGIDKEKAFTGQYANGNLKKKVIEPAMAELAAKTDIEFDYSFQKTGKKYDAILFKVYTKKVLQQIETADAKKDVSVFLKELEAATPGQQMVYIHNALSDYDFTSAQQNSIRNSEKLISKFLEIHTGIVSGAIKVDTTKTRYMAGILRKIGFK